MLPAPVTSTQRLSPFARHISSTLDEPRLDAQYDDDEKIEPKYARGRWYWHGLEHLDPQLPPHGHSRELEAADGSAGGRG